MSSYANMTGTDVSEKKPVEKTKNPYEYEIKGWEISTSVCGQQPSWMVVGEELKIVSYVWNQRRKRFPKSKGRAKALPFLFSLIRI